MPRPKKYPNAYYVRLSDEAKKALKKRIKKTGNKDAVELREICERDLIKEGSNGSV